MTEQQESMNRSILPNRWTAFGNQITVKRPARGKRLPSTRESREAVGRYWG